MPAALLSFACNRPFYHPDRKIRTLPDVANVAYEDVFFETADGAKLHGLFMPAQGVARGAVLHLHGNAANVTGHWPFVGWLPRHGYHVLTFDYRGYGRSAGRVTRRGTIEDAEAALAYLQARPKVGDGPVVVFGQSIGGAIATVLVERHEDAVSGLVMDAAFSSYRRVAAFHVKRSVLLTMLGWWYPSVVKDEFEPVAAIRNITDTPKFIMHGDADGVVPVEMGHELFEAAREPKELWIIPEEGHCSVWNEGGAIARERVLAFIEACRSDHAHRDENELAVDSIQ